MVGRVRPICNKKFMVQSKCHIYSVNKYLNTKRSKKLEKTSHQDYKSTYIANLLSLESQLSIAISF